MKNLEHVIKSILFFFNGKILRIMLQLKKVMYTKQIFLFIFASSQYFAKTLMLQLNKNRKYSRL